MSLLAIILTLLVVILGLYIVNSSAKIPAILSIVLNSVVAVAVVIWLLKVLQIWDALANIH